MLRLLERHPSAVFSEQDLLGKAGEDFDTFRHLGLLSLVDSPSSVVTCVRGEATYIVMRQGDGWIGVEADEEDPQIIAVEESEIRRWKADLPALAAYLHRTNGLTGSPERITDRLWFLGEHSGRSFLLGLYRSEALLVSEALSLPQRFPSATNGFGLILPSCEISPSTLRQLQDRWITLTHFAEGTAFQIDVEGRHAPAEQDTDEFVYLDNYRSISLRGTAFMLSERQAAVVAALHRAHRLRLPGLPWDSIQANLKALNYFPERMADVFKGVRHWRELIVLVRPGFYRLNV